MEQTNYSQEGNYSTPPPVQPPTDNKKMAAGLLGIFLGTIGFHKFYLGYTSEGVIMLLVSLLGGIVTCGISTSIMGIIGIIEGIVYLTKTDEEFYNTYQLNKKGWF